MIQTMDCFGTRFNVMTTNLVQLNILKAHVVLRLLRRRNEAGQKLHYTKLIKVNKMLPEK